MTANVYVGDLNEQEDDVALFNRVLAENEAEFAANPDPSFAMKYGTVLMSASVLDKVWEMSDEEEAYWASMPAVRLLLYVGACCVRPC